MIRRALSLTFRSPRMARIPIASMRHLSFKESEEGVENLRPMFSEACRQDRSKRNSSKHKTSAKETKKQRTYLAYGKAAPRR